MSAARLRRRCCRALATVFAGLDQAAAQSARPCVDDRRADGRDHRRPHPGDCARRSRPGRSRRQHRRGRVHVRDGPERHARPVLARALTGGLRRARHAGRLRLDVPRGGAGAREHARRTRDHVDSPDFRRHSGGAAARPTITPTAKRRGGSGICRAPSCATPRPPRPRSSRSTDYKPRLVPHGRIRPGGHVVSHPDRLQRPAQLRHDQHVVVGDAMAAVGRAARDRLRLGRRADRIARRLADSRDDGRGRPGVVGGAGRIPDQRGAAARRDARVLLQHAGLRGADRRGAVADAGELAQRRRDLRLRPVAVRAAAHARLRRPDRSLRLHDAARSRQPARRPARAGAAAHVRAGEP